MRSEIRYAKSGSVHIAYQVIGDGPLDLVVVPGWVSNIDCFWEEPSIERFLNRLASFSRLILFDKRGTGLSDRITATPILEERMDDVRAVMEAVGSQKAALLGYSEGGPMCILFAATYPQRTHSVVMIGSFARRLQAPGFDCGRSRRGYEEFIETIRDKWGGPVGLEARAPDLVAGSGLMFDDQGLHRLKGVPGNWHLFRVKK
jgi:pimeloyl-ACP methyl ester carboxylesterase